MFKLKIRKLLKIFLIFVLVSSWLLAGWPPIWLNPRIPPKIQEAQAATVPIVESYSTDTTGGTTDTTVSLAMPSGLAAGDLILVIFIDEQSNTNDCPAITSPDAYTQITHGNNSADVQAAIYWRIATGSETWPLVIAGTTGDYAVGWALRISGVDTADPIHQTGSWAGVGATATSGNIPEVTTTVNNCLILAVHGFDGSDGNTTFSGTGWSVDQTLEDPVDNTGGAYAVWGQKDLATAGGSVSCDWSTDVTADGWVGIQIAITPNPNEAPTLSISQPDGVDDTVTAGTSYNITYTLSDPDDAATVDFYYDTDGSGLDGTAISGCQDQAEGTNATCSWDTTGLGGNLYVYGITDDGVNDPVSDYSPGQITIKASTGTVCSSAITFSDFPGSPTAWNELFWTETEGGGASVTMQIASNADCSSLISDGAFSGCDFSNQPEANNTNSEGFATSPVDISCLDEGSYGVIYLKTTLTAGTGSPTLDDWGVSVPENPWLLFGLTPFLLGLMRRFRKKMEFRV